MNRKESQLPLATEDWGWKYHHLGVPTKEVKPNEIYLPQYKFYVSGFSTSPFGVEWMRFEKDSTIHPLIQTVPHLAFQVNSIEKEMKRPGLKLLTPIDSPAPGIHVVMIEHNGAPIELIEFD